jgi:hypothetical protein
MSKNTLWLTLLLMAGACQPNSVNDQFHSELNDPPFVVNRRLFTEVKVHMNSTRICGEGPVTRNCMDMMDALQNRLMALRPLPVPDSGQAVTMSQDEAHRRYQAFLDTHKGDNIVPVFQQLYARILLNQYGILAGKNTERAVYYLEQLVGSGSLDFATQTNALTVLNGKIPANKFQSLLDTILISAEKQNKSRIQMTAILTKIVADSMNREKRVISGNLRPEFMRQMMRRTLTDLNVSDLPQKIDALKKIQNALKS